MKRVSILKALAVLSFVTFINVYFILNNTWKLFSFEDLFTNPCECKELQTISQGEADLYQPDLKNIRTYDLLDEVNINYPSYIWTHTGWDVSYKTLKQEVYDTINVHVVPFSHNDPGWLSTPDNYFQGLSTYILDNALVMLKNNQNYTFSWSEIWFIKRWYLALNPANQASFQRIISEGRFEILTGSMIMVGEATTHYTAILDQLQHGNKWLVDTFNLSVDTAWSLDSFGHSASLTKILTQADIEYLYIQRTHYAIKEHLSLQRAAEFQWKNSIDEQLVSESDDVNENIASKIHHTSSMFTHMSPATFYSTSYACGPDFAVCCQFDFNKDRCWQYGKYITPEAINDQNVHEKAALLSEQLKKKNSLVNHNNVLFIVGDDFSFSSADNWNKQFNNLQTIFDYINKRREEFNLNIEFSTIGKYLKTAKAGLQSKSTSQNTIPSLIGDFYPYSDRGDQYWSGLYTTRPHLKLLIRKSFSYLRTAELLISYGWLKAFKDAEDSPNNDDSDSNKFEFMSECERNFLKLKDDTSLYNHHDTITGTSQQHVVDQTHNDIQNNLNRAHQLILLLISHIFLPSNKELLSSVVELEAVLPYQTEFVVDKLPKDFLFFNQLLHTRSSLVTISLEKEIRDVVVVVNGDEASKGKFINCQLTGLYSGDQLQKQELSFELETFALAPTLVSIRHAEETDKNRCQKTVDHTFSDKLTNQQNQKEYFKNEQDGFFKLKNQFYNLLFCPCSKSLKGLIISNNSLFSQDEALKLESHFSHYTTGNKYKPFNDKSGAYIFLPRGPSSAIISQNATFKISLGTVKSTVTIEYSPHLTQSISIIHSSSHLAKGIIIDTQTDIRAQENYELALKVNTDAGNVFYTDSNGLQMMRRKYRQKLTIPGNFYPITNLLYVHPDKKHRFNFISNRCHGVSVRMGSVEMMLDRRLQQDDWRGLNEGVLDNNALHTRIIFIPERLGEVLTSQKSEFVSALVNEAMFTFNNPLIAIAVRNDSSQDEMEHLIDNIKYPTLKLTSVLLPKGIFLVSLKFLSRNFSKVTFLITLHNTNNFIATKGKSDREQLVQNEEKIPASLFFPSLTISSIHESNIIGTRKVLKVLDGVLIIKGTQLKSWVVEISFKL